MNRTLSIAALSAFFMITGCGNMPRTAVEAQEVADLLARFDRLSSMKADEQRHEFNVAQAAHDRAPSDSTRLQLGLMLMWPKAPWRDDVRMQALLGAIEAPQGGQHSARFDLAQLLLRLSLEQKQVRRDEQRKTETCQGQLREERRKHDETQLKIESLRNIDRETLQRRKSQ